MTTPLKQSMLSKLKDAVECLWLMVSCGGWALFSFVNGFQVRFHRWRLARLITERNAAKIEYERIRALE